MRGWIGETKTSDAGMSEKILDVEDHDDEPRLGHQRCFRGRPPLSPLARLAAAFFSLVLPLDASPPRRPSATA